MPLLLPKLDSEALREVLAKDNTWLIACFCAAWCDTCSQYRPKFEALSETLDNGVYTWIDIEDQPEFLGDEDINDFPTVVIQVDKRVLFYGPILPHIDHLQRLLKSLHINSPSISTKLPNITELLKQA